MADLTFLFTALACGIFTFFTWCHGEIKHAEEKYLIKEIMDSVEIYIATELQHFKQLMVKNQLAKQEHIMQCILFRSVYVIDDIKGMYIEAYPNITFNDINVVDWNGEKVLLKIPSKYSNKLSTISKFYGKCLKQRYLSLIFLNVMLCLMRCVIS